MSSSLIFPRANMFIILFHVPVGSGSQMLQPLAIAVIGGIRVSMFLSLIITPTVYYLLTREKSASSATTAPELSIA
jgi:Cu/Ag efflux pump CusA